MSRVAKNPIKLPSGVQVTLAAHQFSVKGSKGELKTDLHHAVSVSENDGALQISADKPENLKYAGTMRAIMANMVQGVSNGFERKLELVGVGFRAQAQGKKLNLTLGFSHPVSFAVPEGISVETPSQTEVIVKGADKQLVGETAAKIRAHRPPEPYKGKGVRYSDERVVMKEAKKK